MWRSQRALLQEENPTPPFAPVGVKVSSQVGGPTGAEMSESIRWINNRHHSDLLLWWMWGNTDRWIGKTSILEDQGLPFNTFIKCKSSFRGSCYMTIGWTDIGTDSSRLFMTTNMTWIFLTIFRLYAGQLFINKQQKAGGERNIGHLMLKVHAT